MTKAELILALEPFTDDIEIWMESDAGLSRVGSIDYDPNGVDNDYAVLVISPASD